MTVSIAAYLFILIEGSALARRVSAVMKREWNK